MRNSSRQNVCCSCLHVSEMSCLFSGMKPGSQMNSCYLRYPQVPCLASLWCSKRAQLLLPLQNLRECWLAHLRKQTHLFHTILPKQSNPLSVLFFWRYYWKIAEFRMNFRWLLSAVLEDASTPVVQAQVQLVSWSHSSFCPVGCGSLVVHRILEKNLLF